MYELQEFSSLHLISSFSTVFSGPLCIKLDGDENTECFLNFQATEMVPY